MQTLHTKLVIKQKRICDITQTALQGLTEKIGWMVAVQSARRHTIIRIAEKAPQTLMFRFSKSSDGVSGPSLVIQESVRHIFVGATL